MRRTRRRAKYTWLPTIGTASFNQEEPSDNSSGRAFVVGVPQDGSSNVIISALTFDEPNEGELAATTPLATVLGNEYFIKRIVGKMFAGLRGQGAPLNDPSEVAACLFGAGFFIARANDTDQGASQPIGSASLSERQENYSPLSEDTIREPWIWRRTWILGNPALRGLQEGLAFSGTALADSVQNTIGVWYPPPRLTTGVCRTDLTSMQRRPGG